MDYKPENRDAADDSRPSLSTPHFDEKAEAAARPVVPLGSVAVANSPNNPAYGNWAGHSSATNTRSQGLLLTLAITVVLGIAAILVVYHDAGRKSVPSVIPQTASESTPVETDIEHAQASSSNQPAKAVAPATPPTVRQLPDTKSALVTRDDASAGRDGKDIKRRDRDEEKFTERARKEEKKRLKSQRKEAEKLVEHERVAESDGEPKPRLVGIYTIKRKH